MRETTVFNSRLQPTQIALGATPNATNLLKLDYTYGTTANNGNVLSQTITVPTVGDNSSFVATQAYAYDSLNRLKSAEETISGQTSWKQTFTFDRYGNRRFDETNTTTLPKECIEAGNPAVCSAMRRIVNPSVNTANNRLNGYAYDAGGNMTADPQGRRFTYDAENKQVKVETLNESGNPIATVGQYAYDGDGKRVKKIVPSTGEVTIFVYDATGKSIAEYSTIVASVEDAKLAYLTADHLGSPRINTNQDGNVTSRTDYMPYGEEITSGRSSSQGYITDDVRQGFTGYETDNEIGLDYAQARYYGNSHGRFTSVDPIIISNERLVDPQAMNLYVYTRNNPLIYVDPTGEYFVGTDGKRVEYEIKEGKIVFTSNNVSKDLQRMADLVSSSGSQKALTQFTRLANNDTMIHFKIETGKRDDGLLGLHQVHDKDGNALEWDSENGKFKGDPAYIKDKDGNYVYKEATITIYEGNIEESIDFLRNSGKVKDPALTTQEYMVATFGHEGEHDLNTKSIATIKKRQDGGDKYNVFKKVEKPAYDVTFKILKEIKEARNKN